MKSPPRILLMGGSGSVAALDRLVPARGRLVSSWLRVIEIGGRCLSSKLSTMLVAETLGPPMQMGPTRRSTPLSPARGPSEEGTWHPVSLPLVPDLANGFRGLCHRRSHRHPVPSKGLGWTAPGRSPSLPFPLHPAVPRPIFRDGPSPGAGTISGRSLRSRLLGERPGEPADGCVASRSSRTIPLRRTEVLCMAISKTARTVAAIPIGFEFS